MILKTHSLFKLRDKMIILISICITLTQLCSAQVISYVPRSGLQSNVIRVQNAGNINSATRAGMTRPYGNYMVNSNINQNIANAPYTNAQLANAELENAKYANSQHANAELARANYNNAQITKAEMENARMANAQLANAQLVNAELANAKYANAQLANAELVNANVANSQLTNAEIGNSRMRNWATNPGNIEVESFGNPTFSSNGNMATFNFGNGGFTVTSGSPNSPGYGIQILADALEVGGTVAVTGQVPIYGTVAVNGNLPTDGSATVNYSSARPNV